MSVPHLLDHIVIAGPDLNRTVEWFRELTGVTAAPGGAHPTGTANALVALRVNGQPRPHYLELIGPAPEREGEELPKTFSINRLKKPTLLTYAVHPEGIDQVVEHARAEGFDPGDVQDLFRRTPDGTLLQWRLTQAKAPRNYAVPFLIDWGTTTQPGLGDLPAIELLSFERTEVKPDPLQTSLSALGLGDGVAETREGPGSRFVLRLRTEDGREIEI
ncbi:VOC family protein [Brachybacterium sacelli]|uniref:Catechol 2,3-dioxygenase-like lactoylglutathione lyase family enzyme n=1 Tax=Brachybacterium sacelli TaxID=173364 RepID=A0ABS4WZ54_9MICO|nr:VOC family protein [Brachybacterium sacelli]MBP2381482.1 catechol 2,3-dioxygenase-like lactoylglutathione lyase family enzyme [Brachybacterium sacelli]